MRTSDAPDAVPVMLRSARTSNTACRGSAAIASTVRSPSPASEYPDGNDSRGEPERVLPGRHRERELAVAVRRRGELHAEGRAGADDGACNAALCITADATEDAGGGPDQSEVDAGGRFRLHSRPRREESGTRRGHIRGDPVLPCADVAEAVRAVAIRAYRAVSVEDDLMLAIILGALRAHAAKLRIEEDHALDRSAPPQDLGETIEALPDADLERGVLVRRRRQGRPPP